MNVARLDPTQQFDTFTYIHVRVHICNMYIKPGSAPRELMRAKSPKQLTRVCTFFFWYCTLNFSCTCTWHMYMYLVFHVLYMYMAYVRKLLYIVHVYNYIHVYSYVHQIYIRTCTCTCTCCHVKCGYIQ